QTRTLIDSDGDWAAKTTQGACCIRAMAAPVQTRFVAATCHVAQGLRQNSIGLLTASRNGRPIIQGYRYSFARAARAARIAIIVRIIVGGGTAHSTLTNCLDA